MEMEAARSGEAEYQNRGNFSEEELQNPAWGWRVRRVERGCLLCFKMKTKLYMYRVKLQEDTG